MKNKISGAVLMGFLAVILGSVNKGFLPKKLNQKLSDAGPEMRSSDNERIRGKESSGQK